MTFSSVWRHLLSPLSVGLAVLVGQPLATFGVIQATADHPDMPRWLAAIWYALFLPSTCLHFIIRGMTGKSPDHFFGGRAAEISFAFLLDAIVWALVGFFICLAIQKYLTMRWSERLAASVPRSR